MLTDLYFDEIHAIRCKSPLCPKCAPRRAWKLAERLNKELQRFKHPFMLTLTIDPKACPDQLRAFLHIKNKRCISEFIRSLFNAGYLTSRDYFAADEFQMGSRKEGGQATEQYHVHILVDAKNGHIPHAFMQERWNKFRPTWAEDVPERPDRFGGVNFQVIKTVRGMAAYATAYLGKGPKEGLPAWFTSYLDGGHNCCLFHTSRGFWKETASPKPETHDEDCFCQKCRKPRKRRIRKTREERLANCGKDAAVFERHLYLGGQKSRFVKPTHISYAEWCDALRATDAESRGAPMTCESAERKRVFREMITNQRRIYRVDILQQNAGNTAIAEGGVRASDEASRRHTPQAVSTIGDEHGTPRNEECLSQAGLGTDGMVGRGGIEAGSVASLDAERGGSAVETQAAAGTGGEGAEAEAVVDEWAEPGDWPWPGKGESEGVGLDFYTAGLGEICPWAFGSGPGARDGWMTPGQAAEERARSEEEDERAARIDDRATSDLRSTLDQGNAGDEEPGHSRKAHQASG